VFDIISTDTDSADGVVGGAEENKNIFERIGDAIGDFFNEENIGSSVVFTEARQWQIASDATAGPKDPSAAVDDNTVGTLTWGNVTNVYTSNDADASVDINDYLVSHYLKATDFGFTSGDIPTGSIINGITVEVEKGAESSNRIKDNAVRIVKGGSIGATDRASADAWGVADAYISYGSSTDLWGESWTAADIISADFGVAVSAWKYVSQGGATFAYIDHIRITVDYTESSGGAPVLDQNHYRWRDDLEGLNSTSSGWLVSEDTELMTTASSTVRLRMAIANTGDATSTDYQYQLEYAVKDGTCGASSFSVVPTSTASGPFEMFDSAYYANNDNTTVGHLSHLSTTTWTNGYGIEDDYSMTPAHSLASSTYSEFEYAVRMTEHATT
ncbi:MAG: hypothetical protein KAI72_09895, partial [Candidatus Pacebacteria bacterium]|nr:hypothetical protein [Candidatus Paceibacterota bacterium]